MKKMRILFYGMFIFCFSINLLALSKADSLRLNYKNGSTAEELASAAYELGIYYYMNSKPDSVTYFLEQSICYAKQTHNKEIIAEYYRKSGNTYFSLEKWEAAKLAYTKSLPAISDKEKNTRIVCNLFLISIMLRDKEKEKEYLEVLEKRKQNMDTKTLAHYLRIRGQGHWRKEENFTALEYLLKSNDLTKDSTIITLNNYLIFGIYYRYRAYDDVLRMSFVEIEKNDTVENKNLQLRHYFCILSAYHGKKEFDSLLYHGNKALKLQEEYENLYALGYIHYLIGEAHLEKENLDSAFFYFNKGIERSEMRNEPKELHDNYLGLAYYYYVKKDYDLALKYAKMLQKSRFYEEQEHIFHNTNYIYSSIYEHRNQIDSAYYYLKNICNEYGNFNGQEPFIDYVKASNMIREYGEKEKEMLTNLIQEQARKKMYSIVSLMAIFVSLILSFSFFRIYKYNTELNKVNKKNEEQNYLLGKANNIIQLKNAELNGLVSNLEVANNTIQSKNEELNKFVSNLEVANSTIQLKNAELNGLVSNLEVANSTIQLKNAELNGLVSNLEVANNTIQLKNGKLNELVSSLEVANNKKEEVIKYLENFASLVAHDMKAPIRVASIFSGLLLKTNEKKLDDRSLEYLDFISKNISKMSVMIDDVLSLTKLDQNLPKPSIVNLNEIIEQIHFILKHKHKNILFEIEILGDLPLIKGHQTLLHKLFLNLINNSIVHNKTNQDTVVKISTKQEVTNDNKYNIIILEDNSGGIPSYLVNKIFDLFESSNKDLGNGIGLTICQKIINYYGGEIWIETEEEVGTKFYFELPSA